jgi:AcrR family transcriptional regulator
MGERRNSRTGLETRDRIIDAALETVSSEGLVGTSARVIAKTGGFNQALVFYHFGSVEELLLAAIERANERRMLRFREQLESVDDLQGLVQVAIELHRSAEEDRDHAALSAIVAGWSVKSEVGPRILKILRPWDDMVASALERSLADTPFAQVVPTHDLAHAISAMFLGIEMLSRLDPDDTRADSLLLSLSGAANLATPLLRSLVPESPPTDPSDASVD